MSRIKIKNFGPIRKGNTRQDGWIKINKVTLFLGNQGSGKSTAAKLISTFLWIEKALVRGDFTEKWLEEKNRFINRFLPYHRLEHYLQDDAEIVYEGEAFSISLKNGQLKAVKVESSQYSLPQIMYVPSERNFISYIRNLRDLKISFNSLMDFVTEYEQAKNEMKEDLSLPINDTQLSYDRLNDNMNIKGSSYRIRLPHASSGFQSLVPVYLVSRYLSSKIEEQSSQSMTASENLNFRKAIEELWGNESLTDEQRRIAISALAGKINKTAFINIVEEPEQNLYPASQWKLLDRLLYFNNEPSGSKLLLTSHSPYILNYLTIGIQADYLWKKAEDQKIQKKITEVIPTSSLQDAKDVSIYELDEKYGEIRLLETSEGIPSDNNLLNRSLQLGNEMFDKLLEIEELL